jgi:chorismate dehydratase
MVSVQERLINVGVVNFLNAVPLIQGVSSVEGFALVPRVPSALITCLESGEVDVALASSIDYQRSSTELGILPVGVLSSDGDSLTVQLCSRVPFEDVTKVHCDADSHTSIALLQIILKDMFGIVPELISTEIHSLHACNAEWPDTVLIIGDKVVTSNCSKEYEYRLDLGQAWKKQTGLPFVFATWFARSDIEQSKINRTSMLLLRQLKFNQHRIEQIVSLASSSRGWNTSHALEYVTKHINYRFTDAHKDSLELFYSKAYACGVLEKVRPLLFLEC